MTRNKNFKQFDLEERTYQFAKRVRALIKQLPKTISNIEDGKQLINSSGSVAANYIEANERLSKKDFIFRIKICRKEAKESNLWLRLLDVNSGDRHMEKERTELAQEGKELTMIFNAIVNKTS